MNIETFDVNILSLIFSYISRAPRYRVLSKRIKRALESDTFYSYWEPRFLVKMKCMNAILLEKKSLDTTSLTKELNENDDMYDVITSSLLLRHNLDKNVFTYKLHEAYQSGKIKRIREKYSDELFQFNLKELIPYTGFIKEDYSDDDYPQIIYQYYERGKLIKEYNNDSDGVSLTYFNHNGYEWFRRATYRSSKPYKINFKKYPLGHDYNSPYKKTSDEILSEKLVFNVDENGNIITNKYRYILKDGHKIYEIDNGTVHRVKRKKVGTLNNRSRMQLVGEELIPTTDEIPYITLPEFMKEPLDCYNEIFEEINKISK